jgi:hypothetical protein
MGFSSEHFSTIGLFCNLHTNHVSPQLHVVYNGLFSTINNPSPSEQDWIELFLSDRKYYGPFEDEEEVFESQPLAAAYTLEDELLLQVTTVPEGGAIPTIITSTSCPHSTLSESPNRNGH